MCSAMSISTRKGIAGIEKYLDDQGALYTASLADPETQDRQPAQISIDIRVQHALTDELGTGDRPSSRPSPAGGIVLDIDHGRGDRRSSRCPTSIPTTTDKNFSKRPDEQDDERGLRAGLGHQGGHLRHGLRLWHGDAGKRYDARFPLVIGNATRSTTSMR